MARSEKPTKSKPALPELPAVDWRSYGVNHVAGTDEVGRGCLAGPVYAAAVILHPDFALEGLTDSKLLDPAVRARFAEIIKAKAAAWAVAFATVEEIEKINILQASLLAMKRAVEGLAVKPDLVLIDGNQKMGGPWRQETIIQGDLRCLPISAASVIAKVARDEYMSTMGREYPGYGFENHKGYGTPFHREAISRLGVTPVHRKTFAGVREYLTP